MKKQENPYLPDDVTVEEVPPSEEMVGRPGCLSVRSITVFFVFLTGLILVYFGILLVNPYVPINPFPPRTPLPVYVVATANPNPPTATPTKLPETPRLNTLEPTVTPSPSPVPTSIVFSPYPRPLVILTFSLRDQMRLPLVASSAVILPSELAT